MTRVALVRHGETAWHGENRYAGSSEIALNAAGESQAASLAQWARQAGLSQLYASPLLRAQATIVQVAEATSLPFVTLPGLRELDFGHAEGLTSGELAHRFPAQYAAFLADPVTHPLPGGEDPHAALARGRAALYQIVHRARQTSHSRVLVVAHNTLIRLLLCDALGISPSLYRRTFPKLDNVAISELGFQFSTSAPPAVSLLHFNAPILPPHAHRA